MSTRRLLQWRQPSWPIELYQWSGQGQVPRDLVTLSSQEVNVKVKYHGDGPAMLGCHDLTVSCIQFTHDAAFARIEHQTAPSYNLQLSLRTLKSNCILTYTETSAATERGYIQVSSLTTHLWKKSLAIYCFVLLLIMVDFVSYCKDCLSYVSCK